MEGWWSVPHWRPPVGTGLGQWGRKGSTGRSRRSAGPFLVQCAEVPHQFRQFLQFPAEELEELSELNELRRVTYP